MSSSTRRSRKPKTHALKCWPAYFEDVRSGAKPFEVRKDDREPMFKTGDFLVLDEYDPTGKGRYTGRSITRRVTYVLPGDQFGIEAGYVVMGLARRGE